MNIQELQQELKARRDVALRLEEAALNTYTGPAQVRAQLYGHRAEVYQEIIDLIKVPQLRPEGVRTVVCPTCRGTGGFGQYNDCAACGGNGLV